MRLLVTRPLPDAGSTAEKLRALGHEVIVQPLLHAEFLPLAGAVEPAAIAVTSRNGVRALAAWPEAAAWWSLPVFAVGAATAADAEAAGFRDVRSADGDGEALAALIVATRSPAEGTVLYPAAEDRSPALEEGLRRAGSGVEAVVAYRMIPAAAFDPAVAETLQSGAVDGVLLYSRRSAEAFLALADAAGLGGALAGLRAFVLSPAVAAALAGRTFGRIDVARRPNEDALLDLIPGDR